MYYHIFTDRDATIYEKYPERNTGIDEILQLSKVASGSLLNGIFQSNTYNSRILIDFKSFASCNTSFTDGRFNNSFFFILRTRSIH